MKRVGKGGHQRATSVENTEYEKHVQLRSRYDFAGLNTVIIQKYFLCNLLLHKLVYIISQSSQLQ